MAIENLFLKKSLGFSTFNFEFHFLTVHSQQIKGWDLEFGNGFFLGGGSIL
jgi:hypothetical protein